MITSKIDRRVLARLLAGCVLVLPLAACGDDGAIINEPAGSAEYILDNRTGRSLTIEWTTSDALGSQMRSAGPVAAGQSLSFEEDSIIGVNPLPHDTFASLRLLDDVGDVLYQQEPIDDDAWVAQRTDGFSARHDAITLVVTETLFGPDYGLQAGQCCCSFVREGDILVEDALPADECVAQPQGTCIIVDPNRFTPHPCCPDATGERCSDGP